MLECCLCYKQAHTFLAVKVGVEENSVVVPQEVKHRVTIQPSILLVGIHPKELKAGIQYTHTYVHRSTIHNSRKVATAQVSINR